MTINAPAAVLVAMYHVACEPPGPRSVADPRHRPERRAEGVRRPRHLHLPAAAVAAAGRRPDRLVRARGAPLQRDLAVRLPHARGRLHAPPRRWRSRSPTRSPTWRRCSSAGSASTSFAPRLSWIFNTHMDFFEEIAKYRALRRMWASVMRDRFGATRPALDDAAHPHPDGRLDADAAAAREQHRAGRGAGAGGGAGRRAVDGAVVLRRGDRDPHPARADAGGAHAADAAARVRHHRRGRSAGRLLVRRAADRPAGGARRGS